MQLWLIDRRGGEATQLTHIAGDVIAYAWAPDGKRIVTVATASDPSSSHSPKPIVIDGYHFKQDEMGYLSAETRKHLHLIDVESGADTPLTTQAEYDDREPAWAPDGSSIAYVSNHAKDAERSSIDEIYLIEPRAEAVPRRLAAVNSPNAQHLAFSPDGRNLEVVQGLESRYNAYIADRLALVSMDGRISPLTDELDQQVSSPVFRADGTIAFIVEDHGAAYLAQRALAGGGIERVGPNAITAVKVAAAGNRTVVLATSDTQPPELFALEGGKLRQLTGHNSALMTELKLGAVEDVRFKSRDGAEIQGQIVKPPDYVAGRRYPTIVWLKGGPNGQDQHELIPEGYSPSLERQMLAAQGYVALAVNYRGSTGRGRKFQESILADWGHKEVLDVLAAVDHAVATGVADPARLGIGGWSYGGIVTDYSIASDTRFKAAISGAGTGNPIGMYGIDEYILQYNEELGPPWKNPALYMKLSYPFFRADRIHTPTLFIGGENDFNVPIAGSEQMYQALRTLDVPTQLVVYPGEYHVISRPSFLKDRAERFIAWYAQYLKNAGARGIR